MRGTIAFFALGLSVVFSDAVLAASKGKLQCWTDNQGQRMCGDRVPPEYAKQEQKTYDNTGRVRATKARQKTADELAAEQDLARLAMEMADRQRKQVAYDKFLVDTYAGVADIELARDNQLQILDNRGRLAEKAVGENEAELKKLKTRQAANAKPDVRLVEQIQQYEDSLVDNLKAVSQLKEQRAEAVGKYAADIDRYKKLRSGELAPGAMDAASPAPAAPSAP